MGYLVSYGIHVLVSVVFFLLIPFSYLVKGSLFDGQARLLQVLRIYRWIFRAGHGAIVISFVSGLFLNVEWTSVWFLVVLLLWIVIATYLGLASKMTRQIIESNGEAEEEIAKLRVYGLFLMLSVLAMFAVKFLRYFV
ncbi:hypothetical protein [Halalkalibacter oceani]|uniref:hypothetical protein n=1 Tax=Halalkalibacter oceani TaxID=1653776 RepID=UPI003398C49D